NIKKLVKMMTGKTYNSTQISQYYWIIGELGKNIKKTNIKNDVCLHSETDYTCNLSICLIFTLL
ncbi:IS5/IS1182 family transposase, partial [Streptococcus salivarius]|nr:IS5/IS1182 family transposase [Streptococcus salivarius]